MEIEINMDHFKNLSSDELLAMRVSSKNAENEIKIKSALKFLNNNGHSRAALLIKNRLKSFENLKQFGI